MRQRVNTVTNAPFAATGAHMLALGMADVRRGRAAPQHSEMERHAAFSLLNGAAQLWTAAGSALFHASWTRAGQHADMGAVYALLLIPCTYLAQRLGLFGPGRAGHASFCAVATSAVAYTTLHKWRLKSATAVPVMVASLCGLMLLWLWAGSPDEHASFARAFFGPIARTRPKGLSMRLLAASAVCAGCAFAATAWDMRSGAACAPRSLMQWHSVWHVSAAAALWLLYAFLRSEAPADVGSAADAGGDDA